MDYKKRDMVTVSFGLHNKIMLDFSLFSWKTYIIHNTYVFEKFFILNIRCTIEFLAKFLKHPLIIEMMCIMSI